MRDLDIDIGKLVTAATNPVAALGNLAGSPEDLLKSERLYDLYAKQLPAVREKLGIAEHIPDAVVLADMMRHDRGRGKSNQVPNWGNKPFVRWATGDTKKDIPLAAAEHRATAQLPDLVGPGMAAGALPYELAKAAGVKTRTTPEAKAVDPSWITILQTIRGAGEGLFSGR